MAHLGFQRAYTIQSRQCHFPSCSFVPFVVRFWYFGNSGDFGNRPPPPAPLCPPNATQCTQESAEGRNALEAARRKFAAPQIVILNERCNRERRTQIGVSHLFWLIASCQLLAAKFSKIFSRSHPEVLPEYSSFCSPMQLRIRTCLHKSSFQARKTVPWPWVLLL